MTAEEREAWLDWVCEHDEPFEEEDYEDYAPLTAEELAEIQEAAADELLGPVDPWLTRDLATAAASLAVRGRPQPVAQPGAPGPPAACAAGRFRVTSAAGEPAALLAGSLGPNLIRDQIASGRFAVTGTAKLEGRKAIELTWSQSPGRLTVTTTL